MYLHLMITNLLECTEETVINRVSVQGVRSLGGHFACFCRGFHFYEVKKKEKKLFFQKENGNTLTLIIIILVKSIQKEQIAQSTQYDP